jgi:hypothetical protein
MYRVNSRERIKEMVTLTNGEWIADLGAMLCRNINTKMVVEFEECGRTYRGKIRDMPIKLMSKWAKQKHGEKLVFKAITEAEEVFLRTLFESNFHS